MPEDASSADKTLLIFFEGVALAAAFRGTEWLLDNKELWQVGLAYALSLLSSWIGFKWPLIKSRLGERFAHAVDQIATDYRYRIGILFAVAGYIAITGLIYVHELRDDLDAYVMPRIVTTEQAEALRNYLSQHDAGVVNVRANSLDPEARNYAALLFNALRHTNWDVKLDLVLGHGEKPPFDYNEGLGIYATEDPNHPLDDRHNPKFILQNAFGAARINVNSGGGASDTNKLFLVIGHRPLSTREESWRRKLNRLIARWNGAPV